MNWFVSVDEEEYGPFTLEEMHTMIQEGRVIRQTFVYNEEIGRWVEAASVEALGFDPAQQSIEAKRLSDQGKQQKAKKSPKKKRRGCLISFLILMLVIVVAIGVVILTAEGLIFKEKKMDLAKSEEWVKEKVESSGGTVAVNDGASPVNGLNIQIPEDAYSETTDFKISTQAIESHKYGENVTPITPVIEVENGGEYSETPMTVSIPIQINDDEFAMAFYYNEDGSLEALPTVSLSNSEIVVMTRHFSNFFVTKINKMLLNDVVIDTGYRPGIDDWSFPNYGSQAAPGGFCFGASVSAAYYYYEYKKVGAVPLRQYLDNNHEVSTPTIWYDDSLGIRLASAIQHDADFDGEYWDYLFNKVHLEADISDGYIFMGFAYAMLVTGDPQVMTIYVRDASGNKVKLDAGHAIVAYRVGPEGIYVNDPNEIGNTGLYVPFDGTNFGVYNSSTSVNASPDNYNSFLMVAKSALVDWNRLEYFFEEAVKDPEESILGDGYFENERVQVGTLKKDELEFVTLKDVLEIDPTDQNEMKEAIVAYLSANRYPASTYPADWETRDYILLRAFNDVAAGRFAVYRGTETQPIVHYSTTPAKEFIALVPIDAGVNNIGIKFTEMVTSGGKSSENYMNFHRIKIKKGEADLTGQWEGKLYITNDEKAKKYLKKVLEPVIRGILEWWGGIVDKTYTEAEIQEILEENLDLKKQFEDGIPFGIVLSDKNGDEYKIKIYIQLSDEPLAYESDAKFKRGALVFDFTAYKGLKFYFDFDLYDNQTLDGDFEVSWMVLRNFVEGKCKLIKQ